MNLKHLPQSIRVAAVATIVGAGFSTAHADVSYYECADMGYISATHKTVVGTVATSNKGTEIMLVKDNKLQTLVSGPGAGMYVNYSKDGKLVVSRKSTMPPVTRLPLSWTSPPALSVSLKASQTSADRCHSPMTAQWHTP